MLYGLVWASLDRKLFSQIITAIKKLKAVTEESRLVETAREMQCAARAESCIRKNPVEVPS